MSCRKFTFGVSAAWYTLLSFLGASGIIITNASVEGELDLTFVNGSHAVIV